MSNTPPACTSCKFYKKAGWFDIRGPICTNGKCDEKEWVYTDTVTGEVTHYERRHMECYRARYMDVCGPKGKLHEPRNRGD